jgi:putative oxidoreductase
MNIILWIVQVLLAGMFTMAGSMKAFTPEKARSQMAWAGRHSVNFVRFTGVVEILGAVGVVLPMLTGILPGLTVAAAVGLALVQALALFTEHLPYREYKMVPINLVLLALAVFTAAGRWGLIM